MHTKKKYTPPLCIAAGAVDEWVLCASVYGDFENFEGLDEDTFANYGEFEGYDGSESTGKLS